MANLKFLSRVTHNGVLFHAGDIVTGLEEVAENLISRKLAERTDQAATHQTDQSDESNRALKVDSTVDEPTQEQLERENATREIELQRRQESAAAAAKSQVDSAQPGQPTQAEIEAATAGIQ